MRADRLAGLLAKEMMMAKFVTQFLKDESGATAIEYGLIAALRDLTSYTIPNWLSLCLAAAFLPAAFTLGLPVAVIGLCLGIGVAALLAGMVMFALGWIGGGDAKLFAASALWLGLSGALPF